MAGTPTLDAAEVVSNQFYASQSYAERSVAAANSAIAAMASAIDMWEFNFDAVNVDVTPPNMSDIPPADYQKPTLEQNSFTAPYAPSMTFTPIDPDEFVPPAGEAVRPGDYTPYAMTFHETDSLSLNLSKPDSPGDYIAEAVVVSDVSVPDGPESISVNIASPPSVIDPSVPVSPTLNDITVPDIDIALPTSPSLNIVSAPTAPTISIQEFLETMPTFDETVPDMAIVLNEDLYRSDLLDAVKAKVQEIIENGGVTLSDEVAQAVWDNAVSRQTEQDEKLYDEAMNFFSSRHWNFPHGAMAARLAEAHNESRRVLERTNNEITAKQAELALQSFNNALTVSAQLESQLMTYSNQIADRALQGQKITLDALIAVFNAKVERYRALVDGYKTSASVYEIQAGIQEIIAKVYESEVKGYQAANEVEIQKIEAYKAEMSGAAVKADVYKAFVQAKAAMAEIERLKIEAFRAEVEAYAAQVNVNTARYNMYQAQLAGEESRVKVYATQVQAYATEMEAKKIEAEINIKNAEIVVEKNKNEIQRYLAEVERYKADWSGITSENEAKTKEFLGKAEVLKIKNEMEIAKMDGNLKGYLGLVEAYKAAIQADVANLDAEIKAYMAGEETKKLQMQGNIAEIEGDSKAYIAEVQAEAAKAEATNSYNESLTRLYASEVDGYKAEASVAAEVIRGEVQAYEAKAKGAIMNGELQLKQGEVAMRELNRMNEVQLETIKAGAQISAQLAAGAMGALNANASLTSSDSYSYDGSKDVHTYSHNMSSECNECGS